jgi:hypothetical protein
MAEYRQTLVRYKTVIGYEWSQDSAVGIATEGSEFKNFPHIAHAGFGPYPSFSPVGIWGCFLMGKAKAARREADHPVPTVADMEETWIYTSTPLCVFLTDFLISEAQGHIKSRLQSYAADTHMCACVCVRVCG